MFSQIQAGGLRSPIRSPATSASISNIPLPHGSPSNAKYTTHGCPLDLGFIGILASRKRSKATNSATLVRATLVPIDCPRNKETLDALRDYVAKQYPNDSSEAITFIKRLLNVESTELPGIGPMNFGKASGNLIVEELLIQTLCPADVAKSGRFAESQLNFMKRVVAVINTIFKTTLPEDCVVQSEQDPSKFRLVIDKIPNVFEVLKKELVTVIKHKETGVTLTMIRHFPTNFPDKMPSNAYRIKHDPEAIKSLCKKIVQDLRDLHEANTFSKDPNNNHLFFSNRSMIGSLTMFAKRNEKGIEIFELSGKKPDPATIFSSIAARSALPTNDGR